MNQSEKQLEFKTLILDLFTQSNFLKLKKNSKLESQIKTHLNRKLELLMEENFYQFNSLKVKNNSKLESLIKKILAKKLELLTEEDYCLLNFHNMDHNL